MHGCKPIQLKKLIFLKRITKRLICDWDILSQMHDRWWCAQGGHLISSCLPLPNRSSVRRTCSLLAASKLVIIFSHDLILIVTPIFVLTLGRKADIRVITQVMFVLFGGGRVPTFVVTASVSLPTSLYGSASRGPFRQVVCRPSVACLPHGGEWWYPGPWWMYRRQKDR